MLPCTHLLSTVAIARKTRSLASIACALVTALAVGAAATAQAGAQSRPAPAKLAHTAKHKHKHHKVRRRHKHRRTPSLTAKPVLPVTQPAAPLGGAPQVSIAPAVAQPSTPVQPEKPQLAAGTYIVNGVATDGIFSRDSGDCVNPYLYNGLWYDSCRYVTENMSSELYYDTDWYYHDGSQWIRYTVHRCNSTNYCWDQPTPAFQ